MSPHTLFRVERAGRVSVVRLPDVPAIARPALIERGSYADDASKLYVEPLSGMALDAEREKFADAEQAGKPRPEDRGAVRITPSTLVRLQLNAEVEREIAAIMAQRLAVTQGATIA